MKKLVAKAAQAERFTGLDCCRSWRGKLPRLACCAGRTAAPSIELVHRFPNNPREIDGGLRWDLNASSTALRKACASAPRSPPRASAPSPSMAGPWTMCASMPPARRWPTPSAIATRAPSSRRASAHRKCSQERMRELTGVQILPLNTVYQLHADKLAGLPEGQAVAQPPRVSALPLGRRARRRVHQRHPHRAGRALQQAVVPRDLQRARASTSPARPSSSRPAPHVGKLSGPLAALPAFADTTLIAPACHDTASAIAGIPATGNDWAYISSGTWSLVGTLIEQPRNNAAAAADNFTNLGAVGDRICFHKNVNGMWLIRQCTDQWAAGRQERGPSSTSVAAAEQVPCPEGLLDVDDPDLLLPEHMPQRINAQRSQARPRPARRVPANAPAFASLIFHSLAARYAKVLDRVALLTGKRLKRLFIVGGANQNAFLNRLTAEATEARSLPRIARKLHRRQLRRAARDPRRQPRPRHRSLRRARRPLGRPLHRSPRRRPRARSRHATSAAVRPCHIAHLRCGSPTPTHGLLH